MRPHQWAKNLLVFVPLILGGDIDEAPIWMNTAVAFVALSLIASSAYLINDIVDASEDRRHWSKNRRPIASGELGVGIAKVAAAIGLAAGFAIALYISPFAAVLLMAYLVLTLGYTFFLKRIPLLDGFILAVLFTFRLVIGTVTAEADPSAWLYVFSLFLFMSLSLAKRHTELSRAIASRREAAIRRGYRAGDLGLVLTVGIASGLAAVIVMILYIIEDAFHESFEGSAFSLWGFPPIIFLLICRIWLVTVRGDMHDDPVSFMLTDKWSYLLAALLAICFAFAWID